VNTKIQRNICAAVFIVAFLNFVVFWFVAVYLGGDAINGRAAAGHFYLMSHGKYTEVGQAVFDYSKWHVYSTWITHPLGLLAGYLYFRTRG
jgi:hypothetical protein